MCAGEQSGQGLALTWGHTREGFVAVGLVLGPEVLGFEQQDQFRRQVRDAVFGVPDDVGWRNLSIGHLSRKMPGSSHERTSGGEGDRAVAATSILCLHGYHGSAAILRQQISRLTQALPVKPELIFVDAPSLSANDFGWWHEGFSGWDRTREWALELLARQHFDGLFGFSQGAALTGLLAAVQQTETSGDLFRFAIMVGGFTSPLPQHAHLFERKLSLPSLHITGRSDSIVAMRDSLALADRFDHPSIIEHGGGHVIPASPEIVSLVAGFLQRQSTVDA
jgi:predicted esterase